MQTSVLGSETERSMGKDFLLDLTMTYDGNGNILSKGNITKMEHYSYDAMNRLTQVTSNHAMETYHYDLAGNRIRKESKLPCVTQEYRYYPRKSNRRNNSE